MFKKMLMGIAMVALVGSQAVKADIALWDFDFNVDGTVANGFDILDGFATIAGLDLSAFDDETGLGQVSLTIGGTGPHSILAMFDLEMSETVNTLFNENGSTPVPPVPAPSGLTWEVDEPGYEAIYDLDMDGTPETTGDIYDNLLAGSFDNSIFNGQNLTDDVSVGLGWNFSLTSGQTANIIFDISDLAPVPGTFYILHSDPDSDESVYFTTSLDIRGGGQDVPEPATISLLMLGAAMIGFSSIRKRK